MKIDNGTALARIKVILSKYYEMVGKKEIVEWEGTQVEILEGIDDVLRDTDIDVKKVVIERLESDKRRVLL